MGNSNGAKCPVCHGDGVVEVGDRDLGGGLQAVAVACPCSGGDLANLTDEQVDALAMAAKQDELSKDWGRARAALYAAFQLLEQAMKDEAMAQVRHCFAPAVELSAHDLERFDDYRWKVAAAQLDLDAASRAEHDAYSRWAGRPTVADDQAAEADPVGPHGSWS